MAQFDTIGTFDPSQTYALDATNLATLGAPAIPGSIRWRVHPSGPKYGLQGFRLLLNESSSSIAAATGAVMGTATAHTGLSATGLWGAALTTPLQMLAGTPIVAVADDYWGWFQVYGVALDGLDCADDIDAGDLIETAASGTINDTAGTGVIVGRALEAKTDETPADVFLTIVQPR